MRARLLLLLSASVVPSLACQPAMASGGLNCSADAGGVTFDLSGGVTRGMGAPLFAFDGKLEARIKGVAADLGRTTFTRDHVAQYWLDGEELRLVLYREREGSQPHGYVQLSLESKARGGDDDEGSYEGRYALTFFDSVDENNMEGLTVNREGDVACFAE